MHVGGVATAGGRSKMRLEVLPPLGPGGGPATRQLDDGGAEAAPETE